MNKRSLWLILFVIIGLLLIITIAIWLDSLDATSFERWERIGKALVGLVGLTGIAVAAWRSEVAARNVALVEQGQVTERFTKAVAMLYEEGLPTRLGGIYAL